MPRLHGRSPALPERAIRVGSLALVCAAIAAPRLAIADDRALALQAFKEGRELMAAGKVAEACPKFAAAAQLSPTAGVRLNLAECYAKLGKIASAWTKATEALGIAERAGDAAAVKIAQGQLAGLKPRLSYLTVNVAKPAAPGLEVSLDGDRIPDALWGMESPADPGPHEVVARATAVAPWNSQATVTDEGSRTTVVVPVLAPPAPVVSAPAPATLPLATGAAPFWTRRTAHTSALVTAGLGIVGVAVGTGFGVDAAGKQSDYNQIKARGTCTTQCVAESQQAVSAATGSTVGFVVGGVLVAAGAVLWLTAPAANAGEPKLGVAPIAGPSELGAGVTGSF